MGYAYLFAVLVCNNGPFRRTRVGPEHYSILVEAANDRGTRAGGLR